MNWTSFAVDYCFALIVVCGAAMTIHTWRDNRLQRRANQRIARRLATTHAVLVSSVCPACGDVVVTDGENAAVGVVMHARNLVAHELETHPGRPMGAHIEATLMQTRSPT